MGGVVIDGRAVLRLECTVAELKKVLGDLQSLQEQTKGLEIQNRILVGVQATVIGLHFVGQVPDFETVLRGLKKIRASAAIDTVPLPELPAIGTWPTPEQALTSFGWTIVASI